MQVNKHDVCLVKRDDKWLSLALQFLSIYEENGLVSMQKIGEKNRYMLQDD